MPLLETKGAASAQGYGLTVGAAAEPVYVEDVMSTFLYTGNGSTQAINNGIDLAGKGGLVWFKSRSTTNSHRIFDTARGIHKFLNSSDTGAQTTNTSTLTAFNSTGFDIGSSSVINTSGELMASWTFRKQPKFFDVVTYTGNGVAGREIAHNLGSVPGCVIVKRTDFSTSWRVQHRSLNTSAGQDILLNSTSAVVTNGDVWNSTPAGATSFTVGIDTDSNANGGTYVAYLFAHDAGGFGLTGTDNVISCGSYTGNGSSNGPEINLGYEPQWLLVKNASGSFNWLLMDNMRGMPVSGDTSRLFPNTADAESTASGFNYAAPTATGFKINTDSSLTNGSGSTYIYIAIRRGPMKTPTTGTSVFALGTSTSDSSGYTLTSNFPVDSYLFPRRDGGSHGWVPRLTNGRLQTNLTGFEADVNGYVFWDSNVNVRRTGLLGGASTVDYAFRRAPGFFDVVCYTGTGSARTVAHNLGVAPELMIVKSRSSSTYNWQVYSATTGGSAALTLNTANAVTNSSPQWNSTDPTPTVFSVGSTGATNVSGVTYVAYLFATCPGVSKVGSYTGNGSSQTIDCGFAAGARFVMVKRTDSTGNWMVVDTARGLVSASDPTLYLNSTAAEVTNVDWLDPDNSGFIVNQESTMNANVSSATYIYLAIS